MKKFPVIVALDGLTQRESILLAKLMGPYVWGFKVHELVIRDGFGVIKKLKRYGNVFVDLKLHDIPTTVAHEVEALITHGADVVSVHASGGKEMLQAAVRAGGTRVAAVTTLSSMPSDSRRMLQLASLARAAGVSSLICPARDVGAVRRIAKTSRIITPGIRTVQGAQHDQLRATTAHKALAAGSTLLVIGRPITESSDQLNTLKNIFES